MVYKQTYLFLFVRVKQERENAIYCEKYGYISLCTRIYLYIVDLYEEGFMKIKRGWLQG